MNTEFKKQRGPGYGRNVTEFVRRFREKKMLQTRAKLMDQAKEVRQLLRRFPDLDLEHVQRQYPRVPVQLMKQNLDFYRDPKAMDRHFTKVDNSRDTDKKALSAIQL
jgi:hypothetical protein